MNTEFDRISHIGTSEIVSYRFCAENTIRVYDLLIIISQENSRQYVHFLHNQLVKETTRSEMGHNIIYKTSNLL